MMTEYLNNPLFWVAVLGLGLGLGATMLKIGRWVGRTDKHISTVEAYMSKVDGHMSKVDKHMSTVEAFMSEIRGEIREIRGVAVSQSQSPVRLTDLGQSISQQLKANEWAAGVAPELAPRIKGMHPYDIEQMSRRYANEEFEPGTDMAIEIKQCAFEKGILRDKVLEVLALELRDQLLALKKDDDSPASS